MQRATVAWVAKKGRRAMQQMMRNMGGGDGLPF